MPDFGVIRDAAEIRRFIADYPDLPICVLAGQDAVSEEWAWTFCTSVHCELGEILDIKTPYDGGGEKIFTDEDDLEEEINDQLFNEETEKLTDEQYDAMVRAEVEKYKPHWRAAILVYVTN